MKKTLKRTFLFVAGENLSSLPTSTHRRHWKATRGLMSFCLHLRTTTKHKEDTKVSTIPTPPPPIRKKEKAVVYKQGKKEEIFLRPKRHLYIET